MGQLSLHSPVGDLTLSEEEGVLVSLDWGWVERQEETPSLSRARAALRRYFDGAPEPFDLPMAPAGSRFELTVFREMARIPYGRTRTYGDIAAAIGSSARAVGRACGRNPLPILIPCHRVVAARGQLGGYSGDGGAATKAALLALESARLV